MLEEEDAAELEGGVRKVTPKVLFSSSLDRDITSAPVFVLEEEHLGVVLGDVLLAKELEPVQVGGGLELDREIGAATAL